MSGVLDRALALPVARKREQHGRGHQHSRMIEFGAGKERLRDGCGRQPAADQDPAIGEQRGRVKTRAVAMLPVGETARGGVIELGAALEPGTHRRLRLFHRGAGWRCRSTGRGHVAGGEKVPVEGSRTVRRCGL